MSDLNNQTVQSIKHFLNSVPEFNNLLRMYLLKDASIDLKGHIATLYCDVPTEKVIFKGEQMHAWI